MTVLSVYPEELRRAADNVRAAAEAIGESMTTHGDGLSGPGQPGWETTAQLDAAARALTELLRGLASEMRETADDLRALVELLLRADRDAAQPWRAGSVVWAR